MEPRLINGDLFIDDRGEISFINDFDFLGVKRFYIVKNHISGFIRAWHAHKNEAKYVSLVKGTALIAAVEIDNWEKPSKKNKIWKFVLSEHNPSILYIPAGYANGFMSLNAEAKLIWYSTATIEEAKEDDIRYDAYYWNAWEIEER